MTRSEPASLPAVNASTAMLDLGLLGPMRICVAGQLVSVTAGRLRAVLAALLIRLGQSVPFDQLAAIVWDGMPPATVQATLRNYVKQLRHLLGPPAAERLATTATGYCFHAGPDELDVEAFLRHHDAAMVALRAGNWVRVEDLSGQALRQWRGPALIDVACPALHRDEVPRLDRLRVQTFEWQVDARLALGRTDEVIEQLYRLVAQYPLHERFHAQLMRALAGAGRRAEALAAYRAAHRVLVDELGIEPGTELQALQQQILRSKPAPPGRPQEHPVRQTAVAEAVKTTSYRSIPTPRQLPAAVRHFTGRDAECGSLSAQLIASSGNVAGTVLAIEGMAGVGKTALAVHWAHRVAARFPDGQLYLNLRGFDPTGTPVATQVALRSMLTAFAVPHGLIPDSTDTQAALYRSLLVGKRMLIILDNAVDAEQVRPLLPGEATCVVLVTSRTQMAGLAAGQGAHRLRLGLLDADDARQLLIAHLGVEAVCRDPELSAELIERCGRLPLALTVAATRAAGEDFSLAALVSALRDVKGRLDVLDTGDHATAVRAALSWSYQRLTAPTAAVFCTLGLIPGPQITAVEAATMARIPLADASRALHQLTRTHLIDEVAPGRFRLHDLVRTYAVEQAQQCDQNQ